MKRIITGLIAALILIAPAWGMAAEIPAQQAAAAQPNASPTPDQGGATPLSDQALQIDNAHQYEGMNAPYSGGYMPAATGGAAKIILPLLPVQAIAGNQVNVSLDLGDPSASPFQFGNYDRTVPLQSNPVANGAVDSYLIAVDLPLAANRVMGNYPVVFHVTGTLADGSPFAQSFTVFVTINDGVDPNAPEPTPSLEPQTSGGSEEEAPRPAPKILVSSYTVTPSPARAGEEFVVTANLLNTNESQNINNVKITASSESTSLLPAADTTSFYFKSIKSGESVEMKLKMKVSHDAKPEPQTLTLNIEYEGYKAAALTATEQLIIPITQPIRLEYDNPTAPEQVNAGDTISVSLNVMNKGLGSVYNVGVSMDVPGLAPDKTAFLGTIESGTAKKGDLYVFVGTKEGGDKYGFTSGNVTLSYEDEFGEVYTEEFPFETTINPPVIMNQEEEEPEEEQPKNQGQWWISIIVAGGIIVAIILLTQHIKKRQQRLRDEDENI